MGLRIIKLISLLCVASYIVPYLMPHNCCVPLCCKKGYRTVVLDGKEAKVTFHNFPDATRNSQLRKRWIIAIRRDVGK